MKTFSAVSFAALALTIIPARLHASPVLRFAAGADASAIQGAVNGFRSDLGGVNNGVGGGPFSSGFRAINWDGVPDTQAAPNNLAGNFFNVTSPRGIVFGTPGSGFQVSANSGNSLGAPVRFGNIDPSYSSIFQTFSAQRLFTALGSPEVDINFFVPGDSTTPAYVHGFGAVFTDVDLDDSTSLDFLDANNNSLFTLFVPPTDNGLSFAGVTFDAGEQVARVRILSGNAALGSGVLDGGQRDLVVMDDFLYGEPIAVPEASPSMILMAAGLGCLVLRL